MMKLDPEQVSELYIRRENLKEYGIRKPIAMQVREAIAEYITKNQNEKSHLTGTQRAFKNTNIFQTQK
jgi:hypothetical protein